MVGIWHAFGWVDRIRTACAVRVQALCLLSHSSKVGPAMMASGPGRSAPSLIERGASRGITVNVVAPGFITTDMTNALPDKIKAEVKERVPVRRLGTPDDIADLVCYLAGPGAGYLTGQVIAVDGGMTA